MVGLVWFGCAPEESPTRGGRRGGGIGLLTALDGGTKDDEGYGREGGREGGRERVG